MENDDKYLPELLAEKDSLDSSFTHAMKLLNAGEVLLRTVYFVCHNVVYALSLRGGWGGGGDARHLETLKKKGGAHLHALIAMCLVTGRAPTTLTISAFIAR